MGDDNEALPTNAIPMPDTAYWTQYLWRCRGFDKNEPYDQGWAVGLVADVADELDDGDGLGWFAMLHPWRVFESIEALLHKPTAGARNVADHLLNNLVEDDLVIGDVDAILRDGLRVARLWYPSDGTALPPTTGGPDDLPVNPAHGFLLYLGVIIDLLDEEGVPADVLEPNRRPIEECYLERISPTAVLLELI